MNLDKQEIIALKKQYEVQRKTIVSLKNKVSKRKKRIDQLNNALEASNYNTLLIPRKVVRDRVLTASFHRLSRTTLWRRRKETIKACMALHGTASSNKGPLMSGLTNELFKSFHPKEVTKEIIKDASIKAATLDQGCGK